MAACRKEALQREVSAVEAVLHKTDINEEQA